MSAASERRYIKFAARQAAARTKEGNAIFARDLNAIQKDIGAVTPFSDVHFVQGHGGWWAECPTTGHGFWFKTLRKAVRAFNVAIFITENMVIVGTPARAGGAQ